ncbi:MAG: hypothetical protein LBJ36_05290 [Synergistaceae bacterium]|jgi:type II restriction enzyme|nr:hypothetical protein [Synergistaceae bacterium]
MLINTANDLITSWQETRTGFIEFALEKNRRSKSFIESAKAFRYFASKARTPAALLTIAEIREPLLTASGLSDKSLRYFTEADKDNAINALIKNFLEPAGDDFIDEVVYRYLLIKGDTLGGSMRNVIGALAQQKLIRSLLSVMSLNDMDYKWLSSGSKIWKTKPKDDYEIENKMKAISWRNLSGFRTFAFNLTIPVVSKNIDLCLFSCSTEEYALGRIVTNANAPIMFGELKGGIDPAGADEHWKTANTALNRIRASFSNRRNSLLTSFIGAAIEQSMASEIFTQLQDETLSYAANLTKTEQIYEYCKWLLFL